MSNRFLEMEFIENDSFKKVHEQSPALYKNKEMIPQNRGEKGGEQRTVVN